MPADSPPATLDERRSGQTLELRISNPARANALTDEILDAITRVCNRPPDGVRVILLGAAGDRHFSAGVDLAGVDGDALGQRLRDGESALRRAAVAIDACTVPVVAVIGGATVGGALELAAACDWRIAADSAVFAMPAARLGVVYSPEGLRRFIDLLGPARTRQLFLTGARVDAARAFAIGLVDDVVSLDVLWDDAEAAASAILRAAPGAVAGTRAAIDAIMGPMDDQVRANIGVIRETAYRGAEFREGLRAFRERREPDWEHTPANPESPPD